MTNDEIRQGPNLIHGFGTTVVIPSNAVFCRDNFDNLIITLKIE